MRTDYCKSEKHWEMRLQPAVISVSGKVASRARSSAKGAEGVTFVAGAA